MGVSMVLGVPAREDPAEESSEAVDTGVSGCRERSPAALWARTGTTGLKGELTTTVCAGAVAVTVELSASPRLEERKVAGELKSVLWLLRPPGVDAVEPGAVPACPEGSRVSAGGRSWGWGCTVHLWWSLRQQGRTRCARRCWE